MTKTLKETMREIKENNSRIPQLLWGRNATLWLLDDEKFGINQKGNILFRDEKNKIKVHSFKTFFLKPRLKSCVEKEIKEKANEYLLFKKLHQKTLKPREIIACRNAEIRRLLLIRYGYDKFLAELKGVTIHRDGSSELVKLRWNKKEETLKLVKVKDSSTDRVYVLRVPPDMKTCRQAIAWTFGLSSSEYKPLVET